MLVGLAVEPRSSCDPVEHQQYPAAAAEEEEEEMVELVVVEVGKVPTTCEKAKYHWHIRTHGSSFLPLVREGGEGGALKVRTISTEADGCSPSAEPETSKGCRKAAPTRSSTP